MVGYGFEMDFDYLVTDNFLVSAALSYNETEIKDQDLAVQICGAPAGCSVVNTVIDGTDLAQINGNPLPQAPEWIFNTTARWSMDIGGAGEFYLFGDYFYRDNVNFFLYDALEFRGEALWELGLRAGYLFGENQRYEVAAFGRNITDET